MSILLQHTSIRASAGTGKTFQLANRYLALLLLQGLNGGKTAPERIVAVTFTRKGAGEFAERILNRLAAAAGDPTKREELKADLDRLVQGDPAEGVAGLAPGAKLVVDAATLQEALAQMIDDFDRLALGTIDSFMARSVQTLSFELGLGAFEILEEAAIQRERKALLGEVLRTVGADNLESFYQTIKLATLRSCSSLQIQLDRFVGAYHRLLQALPSADAWGGKSFWNGSLPASATMEWQKEALALATQIAAHDFGDSRVNKALKTALDWLMQRSPGSAGTAAGWLKDGDKLAALWHHWPDGEWTFDYHGKARTVPAAMMKLLKPILAAWIVAENQALGRKTAAIQDIVRRYESLYDRLARRKGRLTFDDLPLLLAEKDNPQTNGAALQLLAYRWYQQFDHWLLDEFQDTSRVQWEVLKPWLDEAIQDTDGTKSVFVVGDPKQSIYGWRGGEPRLLQELINSYPGAFHEQVMARSWRSRPAVLELVNRVCDPQSNPALNNPDQFPSAARERWHYDSHAPATQRATEPGYAAVLLAAKDEEEGEGNGDAEAENGNSVADKLAAQAKVIKAVLDQVRPLERGLTCAILVRKNDNAQAVAEWLRRHGVPQVMVEGVATLAEQSPVVAALVDALRWLAFPANALAAGHISATPLWEVLEKPSPGTDGQPVAAGSVWRHWRNRIAQDGAAQITHEWSAALSLTQRDPYTQYCLRQVSQAAQRAGAALGLPDWLAALEQLTVRETAAAGSIHIMTIHKAKGLGFDVVFLPDLDSGTGGREEILIRRDGRGCPTGCLAYPPKWLQAWEKSLGTLCLAQKAERDLEALCVLYVALTRAKEATFVILNQEKPRQTSAAREWILSALPSAGDGADGSPAESPWGEGELRWEHGSRKFCAGKKDTITVAAPAKTLALEPPVPRRKRRRPSDAGHEVFSKSPAADSRGGKDFGSAVHEVFEQIEWWSPGQELTGPPDAVSLVRKCLGVKEIRALFTRESERDEALRELPVEFVERNTWWSGVIDRLVLRWNHPGPASATLVDFKTDRVDQAATLRERYAEQLAIYRRAVSSALRWEEKKIDVVLVSTCLAELVRC